jgi:hypothetical protein
VNFQISQRFGARQNFPAVDESRLRRKASIAKSVKSTQPKNVARRMISLFLPPIETLAHLIHNGFV